MAGTKPRKDRYRSIKASTRPRVTLLAVGALDLRCERRRRPLLCFCMATGEDSSAVPMQESEGGGSGPVALSGAGAGAGAGGNGPLDMASAAPTFLVVNADDLGYDANRDVGLVSLASMQPRVAAWRCGLRGMRLRPLYCHQVRSFTEGVVTSASLLVNGASAATGYTAAAAAGLPVGLHLNLTEGRPVAAAAEVASLVDSASGLMLGKAGFREALARGSVDLDEVGLQRTWHRLRRLCCCAMRELRS